ncbi:MULTISPECIES: hypothetical protein [unclassified Agrococcus]|uniref:hypothetical protein n=1 Tax=unclassified Agrococcus TaxID=2615065 RepID=UPI0036236073
MIAAVLGAVAAIAMLVVVLAGGLGARPARMSDAFIGVEEYVAPEEDTAGLCAVVDCVEGWRTNVGTYLRFETQDGAEYWSMVIGGDVHRNGTVLLDLDGYDLTIDDRELAVQMLFPGRDWDFTSPR